MEFTDLRLQLLVNVLRTTDKTNGTATAPILGQDLFCVVDDFLVVLED